MRSHGGTGCKCGRMTLAAINGGTCVKCGHGACTDVSDPNYSLWLELDAEHASHPPVQLAA